MPQPKTSARVFLLLALALWFDPAFAKNALAKDDAQYWQETGFSTEEFLANGFLSRSNCAASRIKLEGCLAALNKLLGAANPARELLPNPLLAQAPFSSRPVLARYPLYSVVKRPEAEGALSLAEAQRLANAKRFAVEAVLQAYVDDGSAALVDYGDLYRTLAPAVLSDPSQEAFTAALAFNAYVTTAEDAHAHIDPVARVRDENLGLGERFAGIGAHFQREPDGLLVSLPLPGGAAVAAGIKPFDLITAIDGKSTVGMAMEDATSLLHGAPGSTVQLDLLRQGKLLSYQLVRTEFSLPNVGSDLLNHFDIPIGYLRLGSFMDKTACATLAGEIQKLEYQGVKGLILDLRGNGGGLITQAACIGGLFVGRKPILIEKAVAGFASHTFVGTQDQLTSLPFVVLIGADSASASEALSGALQDYQRAWILGDRSFGKASVQEPGLYPGNNNIYYYRTAYRFFQPSGRTNERVGIQPDLPVPSEPDPTADDLYAQREADLFPIALSAQGTAWVQPRPEAAARLANCVDMSHAPAALFRALRSRSEAADFRLLVAEKALLCGIL
jgi:carboxyl-terminal processing protease